VKKIPHANGVVKAIRAVRSATEKSLKALNTGAGQRMAKGDYATAEMLAAKGKEIRDFQSEIEALRKRWREVCGGGDRAAKKSTRKPLVAEGWIEADSGKLWRITAAGRRMAEQPMTKGPTARG
jgi:hypothetical protein